MSLKLFWRDNKKGFITSSIVFFLCGIFIMTIKKVDVKYSIPVILFMIPMLFIMGWGIYEFMGGDK